MHRNEGASGRPIFLRLGAAISAFGAALVRITGLRFRSGRDDDGNLIARRGSGSGPGSEVGRRQAFTRLGLGAWFAYLMPALFGPGRPAVADHDDDGEGRRRRRRRDGDDGDDSDIEDNESN